MTIFLFFSQDSNEVVVLRAFSDAVFRHKLLAPNLGSILVQFMMQNMAKMFTVPRSLREKVSVKLYQIKTGQNVPDFGESLCCFNWLSLWIAFLWTFVLVWGRGVAESLQHQVHLAAEAGSTPQCSNDFFLFQSQYSVQTLLQLHLQCLYRPSVQLHALTSVCLLKNPKCWQPFHCLGM